MKTVIITPLLLLLFIGANAQSDTTHDWYKRIKFIPLSANGNTYLSFGGDFRYQYFYFKNEDFGDEPKDKDGYMLNRLLVHGDLHIGNSFRTFVQLQSSGAGGRPNASPVDDNPLELHQAFVDLSNRSTAPLRLTLRAGRQELSYGSQRLVSVREGPNNRQSFDAVKLMAGWKNVKADAFFSHYVAARKGIFDDKFNKNTLFWGNYFTFKQVPVVGGLDLYYLGLQRKEASFDNIKGKETRHSFGTRLFGNAGSWDYDAEALYQFGDIDGRDISAWTASLNTNYKFENCFLQPELGVKTELISGDQKMDDNKIQTFNPLFPRGGYFGLAALIGPANLFDIHPAASLNFSKKTALNFDIDFFWRYSNNDGIYGPNTALLYSGKLATERHIGNQFSTDFVFTPNPYFYLRTEFTWLKAGSYLKQVSAGKNILFGGVTIQLKL
ncbi:alginate export family protein [Niastella sp. OAS944]|uniref:alginate export family protein n=1 Tax=Niastella sp. OAS944 TaxID=2664089 RepID=UPI00346A8142|nr:hypothetical protein [Chitinophagaceae bacterium OAS944]